ncbi:protein-tyrosine-phosphatase [Mycolicibacterium parafortuitum]|uniref:arsenate reductase/protein-tyrosine-phosphatase family protein n=1 Tax=Mycolicibacterium parafortuitum TaxID=39692 RepID=UPI0032C40513
MAEQLELPDFTASSAGTRAVVGHAMHDSALAVLEGLGGNGMGFAARQLTPHIAAGADLILAMTRAHREAVLEIAPQKLHRTFTVVEASMLASHVGAQNLRHIAELRSRIPVSDAFDILDPIGQSPEVFAAVGQQIADVLPPIISLCRRSLESKG